MKKTIICGVFTILSGLTSCGKDNDGTSKDTIMPLDYFPAFPSSYWVYDNNDTLKVADEYEIYIFNSAGYAAVPDLVTLNLPKLILNGIFNQPDPYAYVNGYSISKSTMSHYRDPAFKGILSLTEGSEFIIGGAFQEHKITGKTVKVDTTIKIGTSKYNNVIMTIQYDFACISGTGGTPEDCATIKEYYAKNVGLIKREKKNPLDTNFIKEIELVSYKIFK